MWIIIPDNLGGGSFGDGLVYICGQVVQGWVRLGTGSLAPFGCTSATGTPEYKRRDTDSIGTNVIHSNIYY